MRKELLAAENAKFKMQNAKLLFALGASIINSSTEC